MELQEAALVTGPGVVSARAPQWCFLVSGANVVMYGNLEDARSVAQKIISSGGIAVTFEADVAEKATDMVAETVKPYGTLAFW